VFSPSSQNDHTRRAPISAGKWLGWRCFIERGEPASHVHRKRVAPVATFAPAPFCLACVIEPHMFPRRSLWPKKRAHICPPRPALAVTSRRSARERGRMEKKG